MKDYSEIETKYFIVLRPGNVKLRGVRHRPDLAPSKDLFLWAQEHKTEVDWFDTYRARFCEDMRTRPGLRIAVNKLEEELKTKDILLICFCADASKCHRSLIAKELEQRGCSVVVN